MCDWKHLMVSYLLFSKLGSMGVADSLIHLILNSLYERTNRNNPETSNTLC